MDGNESLTDLAVCILFFERVEQTIDCVRSFLPSKVKIYILNNGSSPSARKALGEFCKGHGQVKIFDSGKNLGVSKGRNFLIKNTKEEWLFFVDSDIVVKTGDWPQKFADYASRHKESEAFKTKMFNANENQYRDYRSIRVEGFKVFYGDGAVDGFTNFFPGGASIIKRGLFERLGLYDEEMFVGFEDFELCIRALLCKKPVKVRLIEGIEIVHEHKKSKKKEDGEAALVRYDKKRNKNSFDRIIEKHNVILESGWERWVDYQAKKATKKYFVDLEGFLLKRMPKPVKKALIEIIKKRSVPTSCSLFMTDECNFKCPGCYRSVVGVKEKKDMELATVKTMLSKYPSIRSVCVAGLGEPTLCTDFVEIVNYLCEKGKQVGIITNGTNPDKLLALEHEPSYLSISLNGYDNESYQAYTGTPSYNKAIETFLKASGKIKNVGFSYILNTKNYQDLEKVLSLCDGLKPKFLNLLNYLVYNPTVEEEVEKIITVKDAGIISYIDEKCAGRDYVKLKPTYVDFDNPKFACKSYDYVINLDSGGNISGCQRQIPPDSSFGNILTEKNPFNSPKMRRCRFLARRKSFVHGECRYCFGNWKK